MGDSFGIFKSGRCLANPLPLQFKHPRAHHVERDDVLRRSLIGRGARRVDEVHRGAETCSPLCQCLDALPLQSVDNLRLHIVTATTEIVANALQRLLADVAQQRSSFARLLPTGRKNLLVCRNAPHDGRSHTTSTQQCHYLFLLVSVENHSLVLLYF